MWPAGLDTTTIYYGSELWTLDSGLSLLFHLIQRECPKKALGLGKACIMYQFVVFI